LNLTHIAERFELEKEVLHAIISKLILSKELKAHLDIDTNCILFERIQNTRLQNLALQMTDKVSAILVNNERVLDSRYGNYGYTEKDVPDSLLKRKTQQKKHPAALLNAGKHKKGGYKKTN